MSDEQPTLCPSCLRPYHGSTEVEYTCESCGARHYVDEFYVCCDVDANKILVTLK